MADSTAKSILEQVADVLRAHDVKFIVIGGQAEALMGSPRVTYDVDLCYQRNAQNLERLASTIRVGDTDISVIDLEDLIKIKQHIRRSKDQDSLMQLLAIKKIREEKVQPPQSS